MAKWWKAGFFAHKDLQLKLEGETKFTSMSQRRQIPDFVEDVNGTPVPSATEPIAPASPPTAFGEPLWIYLDKEGKEQGPWNSPQMRTWYGAGLLSLQVKVKQVGEATFTPIGARDCCFTRPVSGPNDGVNNPVPAQSSSVSSRVTPMPPMPPFPFGRGMPAMGRGLTVPGPVPLAMGGPQAAMQMQAQAIHQTYAGTRSTKEAPTLYQQLMKMDTHAPKTAMGYWEKRGLPGDREGRQLSQFFDMESYQQRMNIIKVTEEEAGETLSNRKKRKIKNI